MEFIMSAWWFFVLVIIAVGVTMGVLMFYSSSVDIKELEANALAGKVIDCMIVNGDLNKAFLNNADIFSLCSLNKEVIEKSFFIRISFYDANSLKLNYPKEISAGVLAFERDCEIGEIKNAGGYPKCVEYSIPSVINDKEIIIKIIAGSNNAGVRDDK
jgi:hypothetical protein